MSQKYSCNSSQQNYKLWALQSRVLILCSFCWQVFISVDGKLAGIVNVADQLRSDAALTIKFLQQSGFRVHMLSGGFLKGCSSTFVPVLFNISAGISCP